MHAEKCPVCGGTGKFEGKQCHGCAGLGWVSIQDSPNIWYVPQPYQPYIPWQPSPWESPWVTTTICADDNQWSDNIAWYQC